MSSSNRQPSLSPGERQRTKSRSASRSRRTPPNIVVHEADAQHEKVSKRAESSRSNRSPSSSKKEKSKAKTLSSPKSKSPSSDRKDRSKRKKTSVCTKDTESKDRSEPNNAERQDLSSRGLSVVPREIFDGA